MTRVTESVEVDVPVRVAYDQWTQFEEFPKFMEDVEHVRQLDDTHLRWKADIAGRVKEWDAVITEQRPDERVAWKSESGADNAGVVTFHRIDDERCAVTVQMDVEPEGAVERIGEFAGVLQRRVKADLGRFKEYIEDRAAPTGAWRGEVDAGSTS